MTVKPCTSEFLISTVAGLGLARHWFPRVCAEAFLESTKDGPIKRSPDPVTMIDGDLTWLNDTDDTQAVFVQVNRAPRTVVAQSPSTVLIHDATSSRVGKHPVADYPSVTQDSFGGKMQVDRPAAAAEDLLYGRFFADCDASQAWFPVGEVGPGESFHFRYITSVQTPGVWTTPTEFQPSWEAHARWARLVAYAMPVPSEMILAPSIIPPVIIPPTPAVCDTFLPLTLSFTLNCADAAVPADPSTPLPNPLPFYLTE